MRRLLPEAEAALASPLRNLIVIVSFVGIVMAGAVFAYMAAGWSFEDAAYMVLLTVYTVGYDEVHRIDTPYLHAVTIATIILGCTGMIVLSGVLVQFFTLLQLRELLGTGRMQARIDRLNGHVVICGFGRIGATLARDLTAAGIPLVVIERGAERLSEAQAAGYPALVGDATEEDTLIAAGITRARLLATVLPDDAANVFITLSARNLAPAIEIIARGEAPPTERKLRRAGAHHVVMPTLIGAERIARMILYPASAAIADDDQVLTMRRDLGTLGLELERVEVVPGSAMDGVTVIEAERRAGGRLFIGQIVRADGTAVPRPATDERIEAGDHLLLVLRDAPAAARALFREKPRGTVGRMRL